MYTRAVFSERLEQLLRTYELNYPDAAQILGAKNKTTIYDWVKGRSFPNDALLVLISRLFAVSIDWLMGIVKKPYREDLIAEIEETEAVPYYKKSLGLVGGMSILPAEYEDYKLRQGRYKLGIRANLIYAALSTKYRTINYWQLNFSKIPQGNPEYIPLETMEKQTMTNFGLSIVENKGFQNLGNKKSTLKGIQNLFDNENAHPLWDLEASKNA